MKEEQNLRFVVCTSNADYAASLEVGKIYQVIPDSSAEAQGYLRIIDESGDDYGYSQDRFFSIEIPIALQEALTRAA